MMISKIYKYYSSNIVYNIFKYDDFNTSIARTVQSSKKLQLTFFFSFQKIKYIHEIFVIINHIVCIEIYRILYNVFISFI